MFLGRGRLATSCAMLRGTLGVPIIREIISWIFGLEIVEVGLATNDDYPFCGASADGLIGDYGFVEIKTTKRCIGAVTAEHMAQIQFTGMILGRQKCLYACLCMETGKLFCQEIVIDESQFQEMHARALEFRAKMLQ